MKAKFGGWLMSAALLLIGSTIRPVMADEWNKETRLEIREPLEIPGRVLTPGTYIFRLADSPDRRIVQVFAEDATGKQTFVTTIFAVSAYTMQTPDKPMIELDERPSGTPQAIRTWFYPGDKDGWEFVYPKSKGLEVATNLPVEPPAPVPSVTAVTLDPPELPVVEAVVPEPVAEFQVEEEAASELEEAPVLVALEAADVQFDFERTLPVTAGDSFTELLAGVTLLVAGLVIAFMARRGAES
jgi:hypothetical protein